MKRKLILLTVVAGMATGGIFAVSSLAEPVPAVPVTAVAPVVAPKPPNAQEVFTLVNNERVAAGLPALVDDPRLDASAAAKCADMQTYNYKAHVSPSGVRWQSFIEAQVGTQYNRIGENLVEGGKTSEGSVAGWMNSLGHRTNILRSDYTHVGYAVCNTDWVVQHFIG